MFVPLGGQTVTCGKGRLEMGWVEIDVEMGEDAQSRYELRIRTPAVKKLTTTMADQMILAPLVFASLM